MTSISEYFGCNVFNESVMRERLPKPAYKSLKKTITTGCALEPSVADAVANAMKDWAIEKGATHYTHWFQPMTGITAEKHDSFIAPTEDGKVIMEFSGKGLIKGESDASSFPSGGLRATFEARGYTTWDPTSFAFVKDRTLYIPTAFCSYSGEVLDKKTPLLRSMETLNTQALRILKLFNRSSKRVTTTVGPEQEYFLIDKEQYKKRKDLMLTGRTLFGAKPPKGQELEDHYYGNLKHRVSNYMQELDEELWKLGVLAKTKHNEVAPAQHELAPIFTTTNIATDHNQLTMDLMKKIADKHGFYCLLHEKPFAGVNGSGKHNNWSMSTDDGYNLLEPGKSPQENLQFLTFIAAVIKAVDVYAEILRVSSASAGNDHRLGSSEAPPAIMSMFLGDEITSILEAFERDEEAKGTVKAFLETGVASLPKVKKDTTDRNRTSPFAFTGNKFEFRSVGSSASISGSNIIINTAVAEILAEFADRLEKAEDLEKEIHHLIKETYIKHKRIVFNGNNYSEDWLQEAAKRGLANLKTTVDAMPEFISKKSVELFVKHKVFSEAEVHSRYEILLEGYSKTVNIEALTMLDMARKQILPSVLKYSKFLFDTLNTKKASGLAIPLEKEETACIKISNLTNSLMEKTDALEYLMNKSKDYSEVLERAKFFKDYVIEAMSSLRSVADELETIVSSEYWPFPTYVDLLFYV